MAYYKANKAGSNNKRYGGRASGSFHSGRQRQSPRAIKKFDPSHLIKKIEEHTAPATYIPKNTFSDFLIEPQIKENIIHKGYINPTPIQDEAIPVLLEGKDIIASAGTGTGKTAAFLIPLINNVVTKKTKHVLIIAPTRELASQIEQEFKSFSIKTGLSSALIIGGANMNNQINRLKKNPEFVMGTPGRLLDLEQNGLINFNNFDAIVLDEVDRMLDMGFINDIKHIINKLPKKRHSLFFSATIPTTIKNVMDVFLHNPVTVKVKTRQTSENVNQDIIKVGKEKKIELLHDLLINPHVQKSIIFVRTKRSADKLAKMLVERGFQVAVIHGNKSQAQRNKALLLFKKGHVTILIATDVVARGIDIDDVTHVINYDLPETQEDYTHRIGRTGRAGKVGQAVTFID